MIIKRGDLVNKGIDLYRENGEYIGTLYEDGYFWPAMRLNPETRKREAILYTQEMQFILTTFNNFNKIYDATK